MKLEVFADSDTIARKAVKLIAKGSGQGSWLLCYGGHWRQKHAGSCFVISHAKKCHGTLCM
jgi:hypothetical protein